MTVAATKRPETNFLMQVAWRDCLMWAIGDKVMLDQFAADTGYTIISPATSPLAKMIDEACGANSDFPAKFIPWFNRTIWGPPMTTKQRAEAGT